MPNIREGDGPIPPVPPVGPPQKIETLLTAIKVFLITAIGFAFKFAWSANAHFTDLNQITDLGHWTTMLKVTFNGFVYGLIPGGVLGCLVLLAAWAGPELWGWLGPIILVAAQKTMNFVRGFSRAFRGMPDKDSHDKGTEQNG